MLTQLFLKLTYVGAEWVMWILLLLSIVSIALMVERWLYFFRTKIDGDELAARLDERGGCSRVDRAEIWCAGGG
jgi:biopolymer transport protein ExbB/TolQ